MFVKPHLRTLSKTAERVPCTDQLPLMFQSRDPNSWIRVDSKGIKHELKPKQFTQMFEKAENYNLTHTEYDFSEQGGIYTKEQIQETQEYINHRDTKKALNAVAYFSKNGGKLMSHSEIMSGDGWSILDFAQSLGGFDLKRALSTCFAWISGICHLYMVSRFILALLCFCCFASSMSGDSMWIKAIKTMKYRSKLFTATKIDKLETAKNHSVETDQANKLLLQIYGKRLDDLEKGSI